MQTSTVQIKSEVSDDNPSGFIVINESDFNPDEHQLFNDAVQDSSSKKMSIADIRTALTERGIAFESDASKADLSALLATSDAQ